jgi:site-specific recombinase XerC
MQVRPATLQTYTSIVRTHLIPQIGNIPLTQLKPDHVRMMLANMKKCGCGNRTLQHARNVLSAALRDAQADGEVHRNVARLVKSPEYISTERKTWTKEQVAQFFGVARTHKYYPLFLLLFSYALCAFLWLSRVR